MTDINLGKEKKKKKFTMVKLKKILQYLIHINLNP